MFDQVAQSPIDQDVLRSLMLLIAHVGGEEMKVTIPKSAIEDLVDRFMGKEFYLNSSQDEQTGDVTLAVIHAGQAEPSSDGGE